MWRLLSIPLALVALLAGAMVWSGGGAEKRADFTFINRGDIYTLDLNQMSYMQDFRLTYGIREGLYSPHPETFRPTPAGALRHELSEDKKTWTFHLRPECRWSNGDLVTAHDYVFSWKRMLQDPGEYTYLFHYFKNAEEYEKTYAKGEPIEWTSVGIEALNDHTLKVTLENPVTYMLEILAFPPFYPRNEKSMRPFRNFADADVMDQLQRYADAAKRAGTAGVADEAGPGHDAAALAAFVEKARGIHLPNALEDEILAVVDAFAKLAPFEGKGSEAAKKKLAQMLKHRYVKFVYDQRYTRPPAVVTNGAYNLVRWDFKVRLVLEKSATYWDRQNVKTDRLEMMVNENPLSQLLHYEAGEVDWVADASDFGAELREKGRGDLRTSPAFGTAFITFLVRPELPASVGGGKNPLADIKVRQALAMSIDKRFIVDNVTRMGELPARTYLPPDGTLPHFRWLAGPYDKARPGKDYNPEEMRALLVQRPSHDGPGLPYHPEMARKLLAEAGYPGGQGFPTLPIIYGTNSPVRAKISQVLKSQWKKELNIDVVIQSMEGTVFRERVSKKEYAIAPVAWYGDYPDISTFTDKYKSTSLQNDADWQNNEYDALLVKAAKEGDPEARVKILQQAENLLDTEVPIVPIYHYVNTSLFRDQVKGVRPNPQNLTVFKAVEVTR